MAGTAHFRQCWGSTIHHTPIHILCLLILSVLLHAHLLDKLTCTTTYNADQVCTHAAYCDCTGPFSALPESAAVTGEEGSHNLPPPSWLAAPHKQASAVRHMALRSLGATAAARSPSVLLRTGVDMSRLPTLLGQSLLLADFINHGVFAIGLFATMSDFTHNSPLFNFLRGKEVQNFVWVFACKAFVHVYTNLWAKAWP